MTLAALFAKKSKKIKEQPLGPSAYKLYYFSKRHKQKTSLLYYEYLVYGFWRQYFGNKFEESINKICVNYYSSVLSC